MVKVISILIILACGILTAKTQTSRSSVGIKLLPGFTDSHDPFEGKYFQSKIVPRFMFNYGLQYVYELWDSLISIETGLYYTDRGGLEKDVIFEYYSKEGKLITNSDMFYHSYYLGIPILLRIEFKKLYTSVGPTLDYYLLTKVVRIPEANKTEKGMYAVNRFFYRVSGGLDFNVGAQFSLTHRMAIFVEGSLHISDFRKAPTGRYYFWNYEIGTGVNLKL